MTRNADREKKLTSLLGELPCEKGSVYWYDSVGSTMDTGFDLDGAENRSLVVADVQTAGRGRKGRRWYSNEGSLQCSFVLTRFDIRIPYSMLAAYGVYLSLVKNGGKVLLKWINDVLWENGRKISGVIAEEKGARTVVGIGVNLNNSDFAFEVASRATSFFLETGKRIDPMLFLRDTAKEFFSLMDAVERNGIEAVMRDWEEDSGIRGRSVVVVDGSRKYEGKSAGIDRKTGALRLLTPSGEIRVYEGSVSYL